VKTAEHHTVATAPPHIWLYLLWAGCIATLDQASKWFISTRLHYAERVPLLPGFDLTLLYNPGAAFSFLADAGGWQRWFFTGLASVAALFIIWLLHRHRGQRRFSLALTLVLGGALGNLIDRSLHGHVVDFLLFYWRDWYFPAFNLADASISCGATLLIADELLRARRRTV